MAGNTRYKAQGKDYVAGQGFVEKELEFDLPGPPGGAPPVVTAGTPISKAAFREMLKGYSPGKFGTKSITFSKEAILTILAQYGCEGIKFYFVQRANTTTGQLSLVMCGVNAKNEDLENLAATDGEGTLLEEFGTGDPPDE
jgi:hypothetical protein